MGTYPRPLLFSEVGQAEVVDGPVPDAGPALGGGTQEALVQEGLYGAPPGRILNRYRVPRSVLHQPVCRPCHQDNAGLTTLSATSVVKKEGLLPQLLSPFAVRLSLSRQSGSPPRLSLWPEDAEGDKKGAEK